MNHLRYDPTRTTMLRNQFVAEMVRRFSRIKLALKNLIVGEDAFDLNPGQSPLFNQLLFTTNSKRFQFLTDSQKLQAFQDWLQEQIKSNILTTLGGLSDKPWTSKYIESAYQKGVVRAFADSNKRVQFSDPAFYGGSKAQFLKDAFDAPEKRSKVELLATRSFEDLKGVSAVMSAQMNKVFADGLTNRSGPLEIARDLANRVDAIGIARAKTIARTETIYAHAEGQLDSFEELGVDSLDIMSEYSTAGDSHVCPLCQPLEGIVVTPKQARGMIPRHPNCRCSWIPANVGESGKGQKRKSKQVQKAIDESIQAQYPGKDLKDAKEATTWQGADLKPTTVMPDKPTKEPVESPAKVEKESKPKPEKELTWRQLKNMAKKDNYRMVDPLQKWINKNGVPVTVENQEVAHPVDLRQVRIAGMNVRFQAGVTDRSAAHMFTNLSNDSVMTGFGGALPKMVLEAPDVVTFYSGPNKMDSFWEKQYNMPGFVSAATGGNGTVNVFNGNSIGVQTFAHEAGHNIAQKVFGQYDPTESSEYGKAQKTEEPVSSYGAKSPSEDFAEAVAYYVSQPSYLKENFPAKYKALKNLIGK